MNYRTISIYPARLNRTAEIGCYEANVDLASVTLPDLSGEAWEWPEPKSEYSCGDAYSVRQFDLGGGLSLFLDYVDGDHTGRVSRDTIIQHLGEWFWSDMGFESFAEFLASFGLNALNALTAVGESFDGECRVWHEPCYYHGQFNAPVGEFAKKAERDGGELLTITFPDYAAAAAYVHEYYNAPSAYSGIPECNVLCHGQAGPDTLTIVAAD